MTMTWTLVTSGKASIFSRPKVKTPKTTNPAVATSVKIRRWTAISMSRSSMRARAAPKEGALAPRAVATAVPSRRRRKAARRICAPAAFFRFLCARLQETCGPSPEAVVRNLFGYRGIRDTQETRHLGAVPTREYQQARDVQALELGQGRRLPVSVGF